MKTPVWVRRDVVLAYHDMLLSRHGGGTGIRDEGMLDSALSRPVNLFNYEQPSVYELAANYGYGLVKNHPFVDGNKRIGFATSVVFLELNGKKFVASEVDSVLKTLALAAGEMEEAEFASWLESSCE
ncbi:type II toxin-antitoxin system death-on-curing family toxin [Opitutia bacterium ISCC 51]|nr:type II toxin-antitoxin system death-on-curing family toxin [Opitutae bacterium ISCC 51]QXD28580.1 type II toxin-antitoxin system death-on-curing family toxin [Opitutae bacterium ISCC 52]